MKTTLTPLTWNLSSVFLLLLALIVVPARAQTSHVVDVTNNQYSPKQLSVSVGDTVIWTNSQGNHNVNGSQLTFPSNPISFGNELGVGWTFSHIFTIPGTYDYQCDPHVGWGMVGQVIVASSDGTMAINFNDMTPHVGQTLWLVAKDRDESEDVLRMSRLIEESFAVEIPGIIAGNDYRIEFFADHNGNGSYDDPPVDHAWRFDLDEVSATEVLDFTHNTDFKDIDWDNKVVLNLSGMAPHVGQEMEFSLIDVATGAVVDRRSEMVSEAFAVELTKNVSGLEYRVDFFSDHNSNGVYDAPPTDHAWRLEFESSAGDDTLFFTHNTDFTDIFATTSSRSTESDLGVSVYPNPAADYVYIQAEQEIASVILYDARGARIRSLINTKSSELSLSLEGIPSGVYFVETISENQQVKVIRLMKH